MTASTYNRRNSSATPYVIPVKHQQYINQHQSQHHQNQPQQQAHYPTHHNSYNPHTPSSSIPANPHQHSHSNGHHSGHGPQLSSSVPTLSREFVVRRISEGETGRLKEELRCEACGKGYKHISSLAKHLWEHTPEWNVTKKLLISKHQQVQLLEAASILVGMNDNPSASADGSRRNSYIDGEYETKPAFKQSFSVSTEVYDAKIKHKSNYKRSHSVSHYPPSTSHAYHSATGSPAIGGYLDHSRQEGSMKARAMSIVSRNEHEHEHDDDDDDDHLKSPPSSYNPRHPAVHFSRSPQIFPPKEPAHIDSIDEIEHHSLHPEDDDEVVGKMET